MRLLRQTVRTVLNMEMAATAEMVEIALSLKPNIATLVPEKREEQTTEGGLNPSTPGLAAAVERLKRAGIEVSLFIDPDPEVVRAAADLGPSTVELHTGDYCAATGETAKAELRRLSHSAELAVSHKLKVAAGHGLDYPNVQEVAAIPEVQELNIGHSIISRAVLVGIDRAIRDMLSLIRP